MASGYLPHSAHQRNYSKLPCDWSLVYPPRTPNRFLMPWLSRAGFRALVELNLIVKPYLHNDLVVEYFIFLVHKNLGLALEFGNFASLFT